jgi:predicted enzyme related to lactoylglutathione lyase
MQINSFLVNVTSEQPERLQQFYADVIGLPRNPDMGDGAFMACSTPLLIHGHSGVRGATKEPQRMLLDFFVDDLAAEQKRLEAAGVKFIRTAGKEEWGGTISTFLDPDGNYCQIIEYKP